MKEHLHPSLENIGVKNSDMRFATERLTAAAVSKPNSFLTPIFSNEGLTSPYKNLKIQIGEVCRSATLSFLSKIN